MYYLVSSHPLNGIIFYTKSPDMNAKKLKELKGVQSYVITLQHFELTFKVLLRQVDYFLRDLKRV